MNLRNSDDGTRRTFYDFRGDCRVVDIAVASVLRVMHLIIIIYSDLCWNVLEPFVTGRFMDLVDPMRSLLEKTQAGLWRRCLLRRRI